MLQGFENLHSSKSTHEPFLTSIKPFGHIQLYDPIVFTQLFCGPQISGISTHSSISIQAIPAWFLPTKIPIKSFS